MFEFIGRSFEITKLSFNVLMKDKKLLLFPLLGGFFSIVFLLAMVFPIILTFIGVELLGEVFSGPVQLVLLFVMYFGLAFISTFFNVCVVYTVKKRFDGGSASFGEVIGFALSKIHLIFMWSTVSATVGLILHLLQSFFESSNNDMVRLIGRFFVSFLGGAWGIITIFVIPGMVYEGLGPKGAIVKSITVLKNTWGEHLIRHFSFGVVQFLAMFVGIILFGLLFTMSSFFGVIGIILVIILAIIYFALVVLIFGVMNSVYNTALYVYATKGVVPEVYPNQVIENAFTNKKI
jgi:hypothetical protein